MKNMMSEAPTTVEHYTQLKDILACLILVQSEQMRYVMVNCINMELVINLQVGEIA